MVHQMQVLCMNYKGNWVSSHIWGAKLASQVLAPSDHSFMHLRPARFLWMVYLSDRADVRRSEAFMAVYVPVFKKQVYFPEKFGWRNQKGQPCSMHLMTAIIADAGWVMGGGDFAAVTGEYTGRTPCAMDPA